MREILFKGRRIDNGEWVCGYYYKAYGCRNGVKNEAQYIHNYIDDENYEVDPETVGQYIGLTDRNDVNIFEGSIVKRKLLSGFVIGEVVWLDTGVCGFYLKCNNIYYPIGKDENSKKSECDEVIGNIFDNPELLKGDTNGKTDSM